MILLIIFAVAVTTTQLDLAYGRVCQIACLSDVPTAIPATTPFSPTPSLDLDNTLNVTIINQTQ
jgi:hypothetical protein